MTRIYTSVSAGRGNYDFGYPKTEFENLISDNNRPKQQQNIQSSDSKITRSNSSPIPTKNRSKNNKRNNKRKNNEENNKINLGVNMSANNDKSDVINETNGESKRNYSNNDNISYKSKNNQKNYNNVIHSRQNSKSTTFKDNNGNDHDNNKYNFNKKVSTDSNDKISTNNKDSALKKDVFEWRPIKKTEVNKSSYQKIEKIDDRVVMVNVNAKEDKNKAIKQSDHICKSNNETNNNMIQKTTSNALFYICAQEAVDVEPTSKAFFNPVRIFGENSIIIALKHEKYLKERNFTKTYENLSTANVKDRFYTSSSVFELRPHISQ